MRTQLYTFLGGLILVVAGCATESSIKPSCCAQDSAAISKDTKSSSFNDLSIYQVASQWTNDSGRTVVLGTFQGRPQIITMFFAHCEFACPILVYDMQRIEEALPKDLRAKVGFILVTFDTERDTPEALREYRKAHHLGENWTLLRGGSDDVLELAALLNVKFKKDARGQFAHSNVITLLNAKGELISQQIGLNRDPNSTVVAIQKLFRTTAN